MALRLVDRQAQALLIVILLQEDFLLQSHQLFIQHFRLPRPLHPIQFYPRFPPPVPHHQSSSLSSAISKDTL